MTARVYRPRRGRAHLADDGNQYGTLCGLVDFAGWHGTGSQGEYEEAAKRRLCRRCERRARFRVS